MSQAAPLPLTDLLRAWRAGRPEALSQLTPLVYDELRRIARRCLRGERAGHTLQPTALVNEAFMKLMNAEVDWADRAHFFALAARQMRRALVDHARAARRGKRGGGRMRVTLADHWAVERPPDILSLDEALGRLAAQDPGKAEVVELHYFGGLTYGELASALACSEATVHRELRMAKAWLRHELGRPE